MPDTNSSTPSSPTSELKVPSGFELAHEEWLARGGEEFHTECFSVGYSAFYRTRYWALVRQAVFARDSAACFRCQASAGHVHHLSYDFIGVDHFYPETLISVCGPCHQLVEYARRAESLISRINRRIIRAKQFIKNRSECFEQNAAYDYARLLEYQDNLAELQALFAAEIPYTNPRTQSDTKAHDLNNSRIESRVYDERAASLISGWQGSEEEKEARLLPMLELEIQKCREFAASVLKPVSSRAHSSERSSSVGATPNGEIKLLGVEALVVGIKFHMGNLDGISVGDIVQLVREPHNAHDPNAIRVILQAGGTMGCLTKEVAAVFAKQLDAGGDTQAQVSKILRGKVYVLINPKRF
jgi:hypothetical protein